MSKKWTQKIDNRRVNLIRDGFSYKEITYILNKEFKENFTVRAVENRSWQTNTTRSKIGNEIVEQIFEIGNDKVFSSVPKSANVVKKNESSLFPRELYSQNEDILFTPEKQRNLKQIWGKFNDGKSKKILSLSDLHAPFINFNSVEKALLSHWDADVLILNGDIFDGHALSDFDKLNDFNIEIEFEQIFAFLDVATKMFKDILWVGGNHDLSRFIKMVSRKFGQGMKSYVLKRLNPISYICEKYDNVFVVPHHFVQLGKSIFIHPDGYSASLMSSSIQQEKVLRANACDILPDPDFECLVMGHTHDAGEYFVNGCKIMESGCLTYMPDYKFDKPSSRRWVQAYTVVQLRKDGSVDFNNSRVHIIE